MTAPWSDATEARLIADGKSLEYRCWGPAPGQAPTLVLLHEGLGSVALWRDVPERLTAATGFGVVAYARAGYGASDPADLPRPLDYLSHEGRVVLGAVLRTLGIRRCVLLGHSDGATIAAIHAGSVCDAAVRGLILIAPHFFTEPEGLAAIARTGAAYHASGLRDRLAKYHGHVDNAFLGWRDVWLDPGFAAWNVADVIDHWRIPVLAIQGRADPYGTLAQIEEIEARIHAPLETCILAECGHAPHQQFPSKTDAAIAEFCARLDLLQRERVSDLSLPPHAYVPGQNARHPQDAFDAIKASVTPDIDFQDLHKTKAFRAGLYYLHAGYFWECHELLEAVWMQTPSGSAEREMTQALIQLANARLKVLMGRPRAVGRLLQRVDVHLAHCPRHKEILGLRVDQVTQWASGLDLITH